MLSHADVPQGTVADICIYIYIYIYMYHISANMKSKTFCLFVEISFLFFKRKSKLRNVACGAPERRLRRVGSRHRLRPAREIQRSVIIGPGLLGRRSLRRAALAGALQPLPVQRLLLRRRDGAQTAELLALALVGSVPVGSLALLVAVADLFAGRTLHQLHLWASVFAALRAPKRRGGGALLHGASAGAAGGTRAAPCILENTTDVLLLERIVGRKALPEAQP